MHKNLYCKLIVYLQTLVDERILMWWTADALQKTRLAVAAWERVGAVLLWLSSWRTAVFCSAVEALASASAKSEGKVDPPFDSFLWGA